MKVIDITGELYKDGEVYFVRAGYLGPIKIGFTTNFKRRLPHLQTSCPEKLVVLCVIKTNDATERFYHEHFRKYNSHGEWYHPVDPILKMVEYHKKYEPISKERMRIDGPTKNNR